jgi:cytochrome b6-f complex iron-sulfur subunit
MGQSLRDSMNSDRLTSCASCISRRAFFADSAALAALAALAAACGDVTGPHQNFGPIDITVSSFAGLATLNRFVLADGFRAVKRTGTGTFAAVGLSCTHEGTVVNLTNNSTTFICPNHGSQFDNNGQATTGPATGTLVVLTTSYDAATDTLTIGGAS